MSVADHAALGISRQSTEFRNFHRLPLITCRLLSRVRNIPSEPGQRWQSVAQSSQLLNGFLSTAALDSPQDTVAPVSCGFYRTDLVHLRTAKNGITLRGKFNNERLKKCRQLFFVERLAQFGLLLFAR